MTAEENEMKIDFEIKKKKNVLKNYIKNIKERRMRMTERKE
jgi:hypothetical protein